MEFLGHRNESALALRRYDRNPNPHPRKRKTIGNSDFNVRVDIFRLSACLRSNSFFVAFEKKRSITLNEVSPKKKRERNSDNGKRVKYIQYSEYSLIKKEKVV